MRIVRLGRVSEWDAHLQRAWASGRDRERDSISKRQFRTYGAKITLQSAPSWTQSLSRFLLIIFVFAIIIIMNHSFFRPKLNWHFFSQQFFFLRSLIFKEFLLKMPFNGAVNHRHFLNHSPFPVVIRYLYIFFYFGFDWIEKDERMRLCALLSKPKIHKGAER